MGGRAAESGDVRGERTMAAGDWWARLDKDVGQGYVTSDGRKFGG